METARTTPRYCLTALLADALSVFRLGVALSILWLGWTGGRAMLPTVVLLASAGWISDSIDGPLARRSPCATKLGAFDYPLDVTLTWAEFIYAAMAGFLSFPFVLGYTAVALAFTLWFRRKAVLVLFMRGIDIMALTIVLQHAPLYLLPLFFWLIVLAYVHRERVRHGIPRWFNELAYLFHLKQKACDEPEE
jgi:phosphatidylglycerophosphate synthase